jgi:ribosome recycling factor
MDEITSIVTPKFAKVLEVVKQDLATIRTGKATPSLIENLIIDAYGTKMKLLELATINATDSSTLIITPFDSSNAESIVTAISNANLGLSAFIDDIKIRVVVPALSQERREEYVKLAKTKVEGGKVMARQIRHEAMEDISKGDADEDSQKRMEKEVQALVDKIVEQLDELAATKEKELMVI